MFKDRHHSKQSKLKIKIAMKKIILTKLRCKTCGLLIKNMNDNHTCEKGLPLNLNSIQKQIMLGSLLGDGNLTYRKDKTYVYNEAHSLKQEKYLLWKNKYLGFNIYKKAEKIVMHKGSKFFRDYHDLFYPNGKKIVTREILNKLEPLGLTIWFMDDGNYNYDNYNIRLYTYNFKLKGNLLIKTWLENKFKINSKIRKYKSKMKYNNYYKTNNTYFFIEFNSKESKKFIKLMKPFILSSMRYKIGQDKDRIKIFRLKRNKRANLWYLKNKDKQMQYQRRYRHKLKNE